MNTMIAIASIYAIASIASFAVIGARQWLENRSTDRQLASAKILANRYHLERQLMIRK